MIAMAVRCEECSLQERASGELSEVLKELQNKRRWRLSPAILCPQDETVGQVAVMVSCERCSATKGFRGSNLKRLLQGLKAAGWKVRGEVLCEACQQVSSIPREVYTDGSCVGSNPGFGGWGWATSTTEGAGYSLTYPTTNQRMEIKAAVEGVKANPGPLVVYSDSSYVVNCMKDKWYAGWRKRGWVNGKKEPVKNRDLWEELVEAVEQHGAPVTFVWVKGHADTPLNNRADELARGAAREAQAKNIGK